MSSPQKPKKNPKDAFQGIGRGIQRFIKGYNHSLAKVYSPNVAALTGVLLVLVISVLLLFVPPFVGLADDGSLSEVMLGTGIGYRQDDLSLPTGDYFVRVYLHSTYQYQGFSVHRQLVRAAMWLDDQFTHDNLFDVRFLALIYLAMYLPAVYLVLRGVVARVKVAAEATSLVIIGALILGDGTVIACFNSLYPEAAIEIFLMYCLGFCLALQHEKAGWAQLGLIGLAMAGSMLALTEKHCAVAGIVLAVFCARQIKMENGTSQTGVLSAVCTFVLLITSLASVQYGVSRFTDASKLHAMTNGVLLRSNNPADTLEEFNIDPRFETLTDMSSYADYPYALSGNPEIKRDFLGNYTTGSIALYYIRHPFAFSGLLDLGTKAAFMSVRNYVGNYEVSTGMGERAKNGLFVFYSNFKGNTMPQTIGFLLILLIIYWSLFRRRRGLQHFVVRWTLRERQIMLDTFLCLLAMGIAHMSVVICLSGTAELERYQIIYGACVDGLLLLFLAEILHRLNILSAEE